MKLPAYSLLSLLMLLLFAVSPKANAQTEFTLKNNSNFDRTDELVQVPVSESLAATLSSKALFDSENNKIPYQYLAASRKIVFQASLNANATATYSLQNGTPAVAATKTYAAQKLPTTRNDIAWENDLTAYRMYSKKLLSSEPNTANGVDMWVKKMAIPVIDKMYTYANYHAEQPEGVDAYSVNGKTLGAGGVTAYAGGKLWMHDPYDECVIVHNGPLQSEFVLTYHKVEIDGDYYEKTVRITTSANGLLSKAVVRFEGKNKPMKIAAGILLHTNMSGVTPNGVQFKTEANLIGYAENKSEGTVTSPNARFFEGIYMPGQTTTQEISNQLVIMSDYAVGSDFTYYFGGGWNIFPTGRYANDQAWFNALKNFKQSILNPLYHSISELPSKAEIINEAVRVNSLWQQERAASVLDNLWYSGVYHAGNMLFHSLYPKKAFLDYSKQWAQNLNWAIATHSSADADSYAAGQAYIDLYHLDDVKVPQKINAIKARVDSKLSDTKSAEWWWIDAMYMAMPVYARVGKMTNDDRYYEKMYNLFKNCRDTLLVSSNTGLWTTELRNQHGTGPIIDGFAAAPDGLYSKEDGLWWRDWGFQPNVPLKRDPNNGSSTSDSDPNSDFCAKATPNGKMIYWGRGNGWAIGAMAHTLTHMPEGKPHRQAYVDILQEMAAALAPRQREDGAWNMSLDDPNHNPGGETSGTALITYAIAWGINNGLLDHATYYPVVAKGWNALVRDAVETNGVLSKIQGEGEAPIKASALMNSRNNDKKVAFGVGAFLCAATEVAKLAPGEMPEIPAMPLGLESAELTSPTKLKVTFSMELKQNTATVASNYLIANAPEITSVVMSGDNAVVLTFKNEIDYGNYRLQVVGVEAEDGSPLDVDNSIVFIRTVPITTIDYPITVTAIGNQAGNPASHTIDNDYNTRWSQAGTGQWIRYDLGEVKTVKGVDIAYYLGNTRTNFFSVQVSENGTSWRFVLTGQVSSGLTDELERYKFATPEQARYVRIVCNGNSGGGENWNSITEVRIVMDGESSGEDVYELMMERIRDMEWGNVSSVSSLNTTVTNLMSSIKSDGSWADIVYTSTAQTGWEPISHLDRLKNMALAYTHSESPLKGNATLYNHIVNALQFWQTSDPRSTNWFNQQIGSPQRVGVILVLMRSGEQQVPETLENQMLARMSSIGGRPDQSGSQGTGANKVDIATHWVYRGCLQRDMSVLSFGVSQVYYPLYMTTDEGLQHDYAYFQHGQQFFTGGYGVSFISGIARVANFTIDTGLALSEEKTELLTHFTRDAYLRLMRGRYFLYNTIGRGLSRTGALGAGGSVNLAKIVKNLDVEHAAEYDASIKRLQGLESASYGVTTKHIHYWRGDYTLYNSPKYNFDVRFASNRTSRNENGNGESLKGYFLSEGAHTIAVDGDEYYDIFPVWDWAKIPGTTAPYKTTIPKPAEWGTLGTSNFAGGVSNGTEGVTVFQLNNNEYSINTAAKKSWFVFGDEIVSLGAAIQSSATEKINTNVNQTLLKGDVYVKSNGTESMLSKGNHDYNNDVEWVFHNKVGYIFPGNSGKLNISNQNQSGNWYSINTSYSNATVNKDVFNMSIDHGVKPTDAEYAYIIVPGATLEDIRNYDANSIEVLANNDSVQVVHHIAKNLWGFVFYKAATFEHEHFTVKTSGSAAMMLKDPGASAVSGWISDPSQNKKELRVRFSSQVLDTEKEVVLALPELPYAGSTLEFVIDENSDDYVYVPVTNIAISPTDDSYVRDGSFAGDNYGAEMGMVVKKDNAAGYNREGFIKFDLGNIDPDSIENAELRLFIRGVNTNITATTWELYYVANDSWKETTLNWNNKPASSVLVATFPGSPAGTTVAFDVKSALVNELNQSDQLISFRIVSTERADGKTDVTFHTKESSDEAMRPYINIEKRMPTTTADVKSTIGNFWVTNPVKQGTNLEMTLQTQSSKSVQVNIWDTSGRALMQKTVPVNEGVSSLSLNTADLKKGLYILQVQLGNSLEKELVKLIVN